VTIVVVVPSSAARRAATTSRSGADHDGIYERLLLR